MSRTPCAPPAWPSALRALRSSAMTLPCETARRQMHATTMSIRPRIHTWSRSDPLIFAHPSSHETTSRKTSYPQSHDAHTTATLSDRSSTTMPSHKRSRLSTEFSFDANRERDILEAEAFAPLYQSSTTQQNPASNYALSTKRKAGNGVPYSVLRKEDSNDSILTASTEPYESDEDAEYLPKPTESAAQDTVAEETTVDEPDVEESEDEPDEEPLLAITHHVNKERLKKAMKASKGSSERWWKYLLYEDSTGKMPNVHYCQTIESIDRVVKAHFLDDPVIGFDLEWNPSATKNHSWWHHVSVMQLATQSHIAILHLSEAATREAKIRKTPSMGSASASVTPSKVLSESLVELLGNPAVLKAGVNIGGDATKLLNYCQVNVRGSFELSHLYKLVVLSENQDYAQINRKLVAMAVQTEQILLLPMFKGDVRTTDWSRKLVREQILYAASDAYCGLQLFITLDARRRALKPRPPRPEAHETGKPIKLGKGIVIDKKASKAKAAADTDATSEQSPQINTGPNTNNTKDRDEKPSVVEFTPEQQAEQARHAALHKAAEDWAEAFATGATAPPGVVKPGTATEVKKSQLKSYYLWHHKRMDDKDICDVLKLKDTTVGSYVRSAVWKARLPHDKTRLAQLKMPTFRHGR